MSYLILKWQLPPLLTRMTPADGALLRANMTRSKVRSEYLSQESSLAGSIWEVARESGVKLIKPHLQMPTVLVHSSTVISITLPITPRRLVHLLGAARELPPRGLLRTTLETCGHTKQYSWHLLTSSVCRLVEENVPGLTGGVGRICSSCCYGLAEEHTWTCKAATESGCTCRLG